MGALFTLLLAASTLSGAQNPGATNPPQPAKKEEPTRQPAPRRRPADPWLVKLLGFLGVAPNGPAMLRASGASDAGQIWVAPPNGSGPAAGLTSEAVFRWPVFSSDGRAVFALRGEQLVRLSLPSRELTELLRIDDAYKIVGASRNGPDELLLIRKRNNRFVASIVSLENKRTIDLDGPAPDSPAMYALVGMERAYGDVIVYARKTREPTIAGPADRENVFVRRDDSPPLQITKCADAECTQPSLSPGGDRLVYIKKPDQP